MQNGIPNEIIRYSQEYKEFKATLNQRVIEKLDYCISIL